MSVFAGPEIFQNGLVLSYDMGNTSKSWKGAPTTNLITNPTNEVIATVNEFAIFADISPIFDTYGEGIYSISADIKSEVPGNITVYTASGAVEYNIGYYNADCETYYKRFYFNNISVTRTDPAVTYSNLSFYGTYGTGRKPSIKNVQIEKNAFCTPFVNGTRTNSQAILDLTNTYTLTQTGLTFNSDGSFSFNGSSYLDLNSNNIITGTNPFTVESWYTTTGTTADEIFGNYGASSTANTLWVSGRYGVYINGTVYFPDAPLVAGTYHLAATRDSSGNVVLYKNGIRVNNGVLSASIPVTFNFRIGADVNGAAEPFTGKIYRVNVYNRVLSPAEIQQNFNALRGRFGI